MLLILSFTVVIGLAFGSFLGACVYRIPRGISVIRPGSICPQCKGKLAWRDLIQILSPILNIWKCRMCGAKISSRDSFIEVITAFTLAIVGFASDWDTGLFARVLVSLTLLPLIWIDWDFHVIPNRILLVGTSATLLAQLIFMPRELVSHLSSAVTALVDLD